MSTPTPETDAYLREMGDSAYCDFSGVEHIDSSFARKLERERNEAREALSGRTVSCEQCNKAAADIAALNQRLIERTADMLAKVVELETSNRALESQKEQWRMSSVCREKDAQLEAMREAIKEAYDAIDEARECVYDKVSLWRVVDINLPKCKAALAKLKHFLP